MARRKRAFDDVSWQSLYASKPSNDLRRNPLKHGETDESASYYRRSQLAKTGSSYPLVRPALYGKRAENRSSGDQDFPADCPI
jgi:hypothetical protein